MGKVIRILFLLALFIYPSEVNAIDFFVSPTGSDTNSGTIDQPFKTLQKAQEAVRANNQNMTGDIVVNLRGGTYEMTDTLDLSSIDSGTNSFNVVWQGYPGEIAIISGGRKISGWVQEGDKWKANVGIGVNTRQLYVNGARATRARSLGGFNSATKTTTGYTITDPNLQNWQNKSDIEIVSEVYWRQYRCGVQDIQGMDVILKQPCFANSLKSPEWINIQLPSWVENAYELLDQPGEWYLNRITGWIYYKPRIGEEIATSSTVIPLLETLVSGSGVKNLEFKNLVFAYATWVLPNSNIGFPHVTRDFYMPDNYDPTLKPYRIFNRIPANVTFSSVTGVKITNNIFIHLGAVGLAIKNGSKSNVIEGNHFFDISASAINLGDIDKPNTTNETDLTKNNKIDNNYIHEVAAEYQGSVGIWAGYTQNSQILNNEILNLPYMGIAIGHGNGQNDPTIAKDNIVKRNFLHELNQKISDGGGIYSHSAQPGNIYTENVILNQTKPFSGIYLDDGSRYITVTNNVSFNNARSALFKGGSHTITDNWWQDRGVTRFPGWDYDIPDIWFAGGECYLNDQIVGCGPNAVSNNNTVTSFDQIPVSLISNAGLESAYQNIKNLPNIDDSAPSTTDIFALRLQISRFNSVLSYSTIVKNYGGLPVNFPQTNLFAYYKSDELTGTALIDSVSGKNGVLSAGVSVIDGRIGKGKYYTRASNGYGEIADGGFNFEWSKPISISVWVKPTSFAAYNQIFNRGTSGVGAYALRLDNGKPTFYLAGTSILTAGAYRRADAAIPTGSWTHIVSTYDGLGDSGGIKLYVNGALVNSTSIYNNSFTGKTILNPAPVRIGRAQADGENFDGIIDEIGVWDRALAPSEVSTLYNGGVGVIY